jgi:hypothetical protein
MALAEPAPPRTVTKRSQPEGAVVMGTVARVVEISATSDQSFEDAIRTGVARACETLRNVRSAWVKEQHIVVNDGAVSEYRVHLLVTFVLDE